MTVSSSDSRVTRSHGHADADSGLWGGAVSRFSGFSRDARGASEVLGLILAFGLVLSLLTTIQLTAVPAWVADNEMAHSESLQADVVDLEETILLAGMTGADGQGSLSLAPNTPSKFAFVAPPSAAGSLRTSPPSVVTIENAVATGGEATFWDGSKKQFETKHLIAETEYERFEDEASHTIESGVVFTRHESGHESVVHSVVVNGNRILLVVLDGNIDVASTGTETLAVTGVSVSSAPIQVTNAAAGPITLRLPTTLSQEGWERALADEPHATVSGYETKGKTSFVTISLDQSTTYQLRLAKVGLGQGWSAETPAYLMTTAGDNAAVREGSTQYVTVEARDQFNNPVAGATVSVSRQPGSGSVEGVRGGTTALTDSTGKATFVYTAPANVAGPTPDSFDLTLDGVAGAPATVTVNIEVRDSPTTASVLGDGDFAGFVILTAFGSALIVDARKRGRFSFARDGRGSSTLLALMIGFGLVVSLVMLLQVNAVPMWNADVEFGHSGDLAGDVAGIDEAILRAATQGDDSRVGVDSSADLPDRTLFVNPGTSPGSIEMTTPLGVTVENLVVLGPDGKYWDGSPHTFETQALLVAAEYTTLQNDPTAVLEGSVSFTAHDSGGQVLAEQFLVDGDSISLVLLIGSADSHTPIVEGLSVTPVSTGTTFRTATGSDPLTITLPTRLSETHWRGALADEPNVVAIDYVTSGGVNYVTIRFAPDVSYEFHISLVGIDYTGGAPDPAYIVVTDGDDAVLPESATHHVTVAVRDAFGNPASGARVTVDDSGLVGTLTPVAGDLTNAKGEIVYRYTAPAEVEGIVETGFTVSIDADGPASVTTEYVSLVLWDSVPELEIDVGDQNVTVNTPYTATIQILASEDSAQRGNEIEYTVINSRVILVIDGDRDVRTPWPDGDASNVPGGIIAENINDPRYTQRAPDVPWNYTTELLPAGSSVTLELTSHKTGDRERAGSTIQVGGSTYHETYATSTTHQRIDIDTTDPDEENLILLQNGEVVPNAGIAYPHQWSVRDILQDRIDASNTLQLADNEIVVLFELSSEATRSELGPNSRHPDYNDVVAIITIHPETAVPPVIPPAIPPAGAGLPDPDLPTPSVSVTVPTVCTLADEQDFAYVDIDGDGVYNGADYVVETSDLQDGTYHVAAGTLVVPAGVGAISAKSVDISAQGLVLGADITATNGDLKLTSGSRGICVDGATLHTTKNNADIDVLATGPVALTGSTLDTRGDISVSAMALSADGATVVAGKSLTFTATGDLSARNAAFTADEMELHADAMVFDGASFTTTDDEPVRFQASVGGLRGVGASFDVAGAVEVDATGGIDLRSVTMTSTADSSVAVASTTGAVDLSNAHLTGVGSLTVSAADFVSLAGSDVDAESVAVTAGSHADVAFARVTTADDIDIDAGGHLLALDVDFRTTERNSDIRLSGTGDADIRSAILWAGGSTPGSDAEVTLAVSADSLVFVTGASVSDADNVLSVTPATATIV